MFSQAAEHCSVVTVADKIIHHSYHVGSLLEKIHSPKPRMGKKKENEVEKKGSLVMGLCYQGSHTLATARSQEHFGTNH